MSVTLICTACGEHISSAWIREAAADRPFVCPHCGRSLAETGYVEVKEDEDVRDERDGNEEAA